MGVKTSSEASHPANAAATVKLGGGADSGHAAELGPLVAASPDSRGDAANTSQLSRSLHATRPAQNAVVVGSSTEVVAPEREEPKGIPSDQVESPSLSSPPSIPFNPVPPFPSVACISNSVEAPRVLLVGTDSLDIGFYVEFTPKWPQILAKLGQLKREARRRGFAIVGGGRCQVLPIGKRNYQYHVKFPEFELYLSRDGKPRNDTPNVFVSLGSKLLWDRGVHEAVKFVLAELAELAPGTVIECRINRCDLTIDLQIPGGLTDAFLREHSVKRSRGQNLYLDNDQLESFYVGKMGSELLLRIYSKSIELAVSGKSWFLDLWGITNNVDVWRFEFQIRRETLKGFGVNTLDDLINRRAGIWRYLTEEWYSLRLLDNENPTRRTVHPLWTMIQEGVTEFGDVSEVIRRVHPSRSQDSEMSVKRGAGSLIGFAAREGYTTIEEALPRFQQALIAALQGRNFEQECQHQRIELGIRDEKEAA